MKKKSSKSYLPYICIVIFIVVALFAGFKFYSNYKEIKNLEKQVINLHGNIEQTRVENIELKEKLEKIDNDEYIEKIAREELGLVKPGEVLLVPVTEENSKQE